MQPARVFSIKPFLPVLLAASLSITDQRIIAEETVFTDADGLVYEDETKALLQKVPEETSGHFPVPEGWSPLEPMRYSIACG